MRPRTAASSCGGDSVLRDAEVVIDVAFWLWASRSLATSRPWRSNPYKASHNVRTVVRHRRGAGGYFVGTRAFSSSNQGRNNQSPLFIAFHELTSARRHEALQLLQPVLDHDDAGGAAVGSEPPA